MPKVNITRTELVWPGKYDDDGNLVQPRRVNLPFQVIERVNETRATRSLGRRSAPGMSRTCLITGTLTKSKRPMGAMAGATS